MWLYHLLAKKDNLPKNQSSKLCGVLSDYSYSQTFEISISSIKS